MHIRWTKPAAAALSKIQDYVANRNPRAAFEVVQRIQLAVTQLEEHPKSGRVGRVRHTLELVIPDLPYIVVYRVEMDEVQILSVYHMSRKWPNEFK